MPLINWNEATVEDLHGFTTDFIRHELSRRNLETTGSKDEMIERLLADIAHNRQPSGIPDSTAEQPVVTSSTQVLSDLLQQFLTLSQRPTVPVQVTTLPDLSASLPTFSGDGSISAHQWLEELERTQGLASWTPSTLLAVALGKLRGPAADWKSVAGNHCDTWENFKLEFENQFGDKLTLLQWQHIVTRRVQLPSESLVDYSLAKLRVISRCPVPLTDPQRIEYALQGVRDAHLATTIAAQRPPTVSAFLAIATQLDRTLEHFSVFPSQPLVTARTSPRAPPLPVQQIGAMNDTACSQIHPVSSASRRISSLPRDQQDTRYFAISSRNGAPAYRPGEDLSKAICYNCRQSGHLASTCPRSRSNSQPSSQPTSTPSMACLPTSEPLEGSLVQCAVIQADIPLIGTVDAFPDSGSKHTILSLDVIGSTNLLPWTKPPISVVGGGAVMPAGTLCTRIAVGPISAVLEVLVLARNPLPLILGEDWFEAAHAELLVRPPHPTEIHHPSTGVVMRCLEKVLPRMSNAVVLSSSPTSPFTPAASCTGCLQFSPLPDNTQPTWLYLEQNAELPEVKPHEPKAAPLCTNDATLEMPLPQLRDAHIGSQLREEEVTAVQHVLRQHVDLFATDDNDLGLYKGTEHAIDLVPDASPYARQPYRYSREDRDFIERQCQELLAKGIIVPSSSPWAFPVVVVSQPTKKRFCVNYIPLNKQTISVAQPLPRADDIMDDISGCSLFACLDLKFAYWQIGVRPQDQPKTSFITHHGTFQWTRMPFGLKNAPATFQKAMHTVFESLQLRHPKCGVRVYLDDILLFATTFPEFVDLLDEVLTLLQNAGFKVSLSKCQFAVTSVTFLGFVISKDGKRPNPAKVEAILKMPVPTTAKAVLSWIQTASFYRRFIPNFAKVVAPLQHIVRTGAFQWSSDCESAFYAIREALTSAPILGHFHPSAQTTVSTDASASALGAVLSQCQDGDDVVIECASRALAPAERELRSNVWECLAVHWAICHKFRSYLLNKKFCLLTDNCPTCSRMLLCGSNE